MASFNYTVDTKPMAEEMRSVSRHVNATTGAVVAMQTAVIIAEEKAADHVCNNVNLSLIHISEPTRLLSISYAVFCLKKKKKNKHNR